MVWLMVVSISLFTMQVGFTFMASGCASSKNSSSILTNQLLVVCATASIFFLVSSELIAHDPEEYPSRGVFPGIRSHKALDKISQIVALDAHTVAGLSNKFLIYTRCVTCVTIAAVQLQERTLVEAYLVLSLALAGIVFPVAESWIVNDGWL